MSDVTLSLLLASLAVFVWLAIKSKSIKTFQFQISIFIVVWVIGEIIQNRRIAVFVPSPEIGLTIHAMSMAFLTLMLWLRFYYSHRSGKKMIEGFDSSDNK
jgi:hypothetical protein